MGTIDKFHFVVSIMLRSLKIFTQYWRIKLEGRKKTFVFKSCESGLGFQTKLKIRALTNMQENALELSQSMANKLFTY